MIRVPTAPWAHGVFGVLAWSAGAAVGYAAWRWRLRTQASRVAAVAAGCYSAALLIGAVPGAFLAGSLNAWRLSTGVLSHSIVGALVGAIVGLEAYKAWRGIRGSTAVVFVGSFADLTYGRPTSLPWAVDLGDGVGEVRKW